MEPSEDWKRAKWLPFVAWAFVAALFLVVNRGAHGSFFDGPDLVRLEEFSRHSIGEYFLAMVAPRPGAGLDQPLGRLFFGLLSLVWKGSPLPYLVAIHALHALNMGLVMALALRVGMSPLVASFAVGVFGFHAGVAEIFWSPGNVSEVACGTLVLLSLLCWTWRLTVGSVLAYWLAMQIDMAAVLLPVALLIYVWQLERERVGELAAYAPVMAYGLLQASWGFGLAGFWGRLNYSMDELLVVTMGDPGFRFLLILLGVFVVKARLRFSFGLFVLLLLPLVLRAGKPGEWSIYLPLIGVALFLARLAVEFGTQDVVALWAVGFWLLANGLAYPERLRPHAEQMGLVKSYVERVLRFPAWPKDGRAVLLDGAPAMLGEDGVRAVLRLSGVEIPVVPFSSPRGQALLSEPSLTTVQWEPPNKLLIGIREPGYPAVTALRMDEAEAALWLGAGWMARERGMRWMGARAEMQIRRPAWGDKVKLGVVIPKEQLAAVGPVRVVFTRAGREVLRTEFAKPGSWDVTWDAPAEIPVEETSALQVTVAPVWVQSGKEFGLRVRQFYFADSHWK